MLRYLLPVSLLLAAAPAWAVDYCKTTVARPGGDALVEGFIDGSRLKRIRIEDIAITGTVAMNPKAKGYTTKGDDAFRLVPYRTGQSLEGKDWQTPGSVSTVFGAMGLHWPHFYKDDKRVARTLIDFRPGDMFARVTHVDRVPKPNREVSYLNWDPEWDLLRFPGYEMTNIYDSNERNKWASIALPDKQIIVDLYDADGAEGVRIATVTFTWPQEADWNKRMVERVTALRALSAAKKCTVAVTIDLSKPFDDEDEEF